MLRALWQRRALLGLVSVLAVVAGVGIMVSSGTTNIGFVAAGTTAATAAGPKSLVPQTYVANNTLGSWIPGL